MACYAAEHTDRQLHTRLSQRTRKDPTPMMRKTYWATLMLVFLLGTVAFLRATPMALAAPSHAVGPQTAVHSTMRAVVSNCPEGDKHLAIYLSGGPGFHNYQAYCVRNADVGNNCGWTEAAVCLYQNSNYNNNNGGDGGQEIDIVGNGCVNLTDFAGPGPGGTWNDAMSSFRSSVAGNPSGAFWWNTNDIGYYYLFGPPGSGRVTNSSYIGNTWNDQTSSLQIDPNPGSC